MPSTQKSVRALHAACHTLPGSIGAVCVLCFCAAAFAQQDAWHPTPVTLSEAGKANHELALQPHGHLDATKCVAGEPPVIDLEMPPSHGVVCVRPVEWKLQAAYTSKAMPCIGHRVTGIHVIYLPHHAYAGVDTLRYVVRYQLGPMTVNYILTILPGAPSLPGAALDNGSPADNTTQSPGPIPACKAVMS